MEGYIHVKLKFSQSRCWAVLDSQQLTYYSHLDLVEQVPKGFKGVVHTKKATFSKFNERGIQHGITIDSNKTLFSFDCLDPATCSAWFNALTRSSTDNEEDSTLLVQQWRGILDVDLHAKLTKSEIARSYKKLCLKEHPDKGGNVENFNKINLAYNSLIALQANIDEKDSCDIIHYEAVVEKGKGGGGLGIVVAEDKSRKQVIVQKVEPFCMVVGLTEEADGEIKPGDAVIGIDRDDCSHWYLSRIRARLGPFRAPGGTQIHFTFERRVPKAELMSEDTDNSPRRPNARFEDSPQPTPPREERTPRQYEQNTSTNKSNEDKHSESQQQQYQQAAPGGEEPVPSEVEAKKSAFKARRQSANNHNNPGPDNSPQPASNTPIIPMSSGVGSNHSAFSEESAPSTPVPLRVRVPDNINNHLQQPSMHQIDAFSPVLSPINDLNRTSNHGIDTPVESKGMRSKWDIFESVEEEEEEEEEEDTPFSTPQRADQNGDLATELEDTKEDLARSQAHIASLEAAVISLHAQLERANQALNERDREEERLRADNEYLNSRLMAMTKLVELHEFSSPPPAPSQIQPSQREVSQLNNKLNAAYSEIRHMASTIATLQQQQQQPLQQHQQSYLDQSHVRQQHGGGSGVRSGERRASSQSQHEQQEPEHQQQQQQQQQFRFEGMR